jgi:signal transduction histidine kinase
MRRARWFEPPRRVLLLFLIVTVVPAAALAWLGWQLVRQDRALESQRLQERLDRAAVVVAGALDRRLAEIAGSLSSSGDVPADSIVITCGPDRIDARPGNRLVFYPFVAAAPAVSTRVFDAGEAYEFQKQDYAAAVAEFSRLGHSTDPSVRAAALVRLGRVLRKAGRYADALGVYDKLAAGGQAAVGGVPADLLARQARLSVFQTLGQAPEVERAARALQADLRQGRWKLERASYEFFSAEVERPLGTAVPAAADQESALALAAGVEVLWNEWQAIQRGEASSHGRRSIWTHGRGVLLLWSSQAESLSGLVAGPGYVAPQLQSTWQGLGVTVTLVDSAAHTVLGPVPAAGAPQAVRAMGETGLPWNLRVASADPKADLAQLAVRRRLLLAGLVLTGIVVLGGSYFTARAVTRELAVARLQSDFVSAVSHEFRTPLTSMRHLTELLDRDVVTEEARRKQYYAALAHETTRLHRLVEGLLNFGRMEAGALEYRLEPVSIAALVEEVVADFRHEFTAGARRIEVRSDGSLPVVRADRESLSRALWNLLDNAVKYSPPETPVQVIVERGDRRVAVRVRDEGPGIPVGEQKQIFNKFVRGSSARTSPVKGTGIGLAMVQHIAHAHEGEVRVDSEPGRGSTFSILLPTDRDSRSPIPEEMPS